MSKTLTLNQLELEAVYAGLMLLVEELNSYEGNNNAELVAAGRVMDVTYTMLKEMGSKVI